MHDVSLVLYVTARDVKEHGGQLAEAMMEHKASQIVIATSDDIPAQALDHLHAPQAVLLRGDITSWWGQLRGVLDRPWVIAVDGLALPKVNRAQLQTAVETARRRAGMRARQPDPVLLDTRWGATTIAAAYVDYVLRSRISGSTLAHAGQVALAAGKVVAEGVDRRAGAIQVQVMLDLPVSEPPPWRFALAIVGPKGLAAESDEVALRQFDVYSGALRRHRLEATIPLRELPNGSYTIGVRLMGEGVSQTVTPLRASTGATACARTVSTSWLDEGRLQRVRYLVHPSGSGRQLGLTLQHGTGAKANLRWRALLLRRDIRHVVRGPGGRRLRMLLLIRLLTMPLFARRRPFLIGERPGTAEDNGLHLFRHLRATQPERPVYFVLDREAPEYPRLRELGHVVPHSSWRHRLMMLHAEVLADSHSLRYLIPRGWPVRNYERHLAGRVGSIRVFLQHGIHLSPEALNRRTTGYDIIITSAHEETAALERATGYGNHLVETVLPRFDALIPNESSRTVLMMTTWRRFLPSPMASASAEPFEGSAYERFITAVLDSKSLHDVLCAHDYHFVIVPHANIAQALTDLQPAHERIALDAAHSESVQERLQTCDVLVTDYSSVHFDVAYMGRPVIYAQFDREEYEAKHAHRSWFNFDTDGFGPVVETVEDLIGELDKTLSRGATREARYTDRAQRFFSTIDHHNTARVVEAIDEFLKVTRSALR